MTNRLKLVLLYWDRKADYSPDFDKEHSVAFVGKDALDVMRQYRTYENQHDLKKYTSLSFAYVCNVY